MVVSEGGQQQTPYYYVNTIYKSNSVYHSLYVHFTDPENRDLILNKGTRLEVYKIALKDTSPSTEYTESGQSGMTKESESHSISKSNSFEPTLQVQPFQEIPIHGRLICVHSFRPKHSSVDYLVLLTQKLTFSIIAFDSQKGKIVTKLSGDCRDRIGRPSELGPKVMIDPEAKFIMFFILQGMIKILPLETNHQSGFVAKDMWNIRLDELLVLDCQLISSTILGSGLSNSSTTNTLFTILYQHTDGKKSIRSYTLDFKEKEFVPNHTPFLVESTSDMLVPLQNQHLLLLSMESICVMGLNVNVSKKPNNTPPSMSIDLKQTTKFRCFCKMDENRILLSDHDGELYILFIIWKGEQVSDIKLEKLGKTSLASCLVYLNDGILFIGSTFGDSQLVKLLEARSESNGFVQIVDEMGNIGPIVDGVWIDLDGQGYGQFITCSGGYKDASLRVIKSGLGFTPNALILCGVKQPDLSMPCKRSRETMDNDNNTLNTQLIETFFPLSLTKKGLFAIGFSNCSRIISHSEQKGLHEFTQILLPGWEENGKLIYAGDAEDGQICQVIESQISLIPAMPSEMKTGFEKHFTKTKILMARMSLKTLVIVTDDNNITCFEIGYRSLSLCYSFTMSENVSALELVISSNSYGLAEYFIVSTWLFEGVQIYSIADSRLISEFKDKMRGTIKHMIFYKASEHTYLFASYIDGQLAYWQLDDTFDFAKGKCKRLGLGTRIDSLSRLVIKDEIEVVIVLGDRPTLIYENKHGKLSFVHMNLKDVQCMLAIDNDLTILGCKSGLLLGELNDLYSQQLHVTKIPLDHQDMVRRIAYQDSTKTFGVMTLQTSLLGPSANDICRVKLFDASTFELKDSYTLPKNYLSSCFISATLIDDDQFYYIVGSSILNEEDELEFEAQEPSIPAPTSSSTKKKSLKNKDSRLDEPDKGKLSIFTVSKEPSKSLRLIYEFETPGPIYSLIELNGYLIAGVGSRIIVYKWTMEAGNHWKLIPITSHHTQILPILLKANRETLLVGDLMKSVSVYKLSESILSTEELPTFKVSSGNNKVSASLALQEVARDYHCHWCTAIHLFPSISELFSGELYLAGENHANLFVTKKPLQAANDIEMKRLDNAGIFHLGDVVNVFIHSPSCYLTTAAIENAESKIVVYDKVWYATTSGNIGSISLIDPKVGSILDKLQHNMRRLLQPIGNFSHTEWRTFLNDKEKLPDVGFLDGDHLESILQLNQDKLPSLIDDLINGKNGGFKIQDVDREFIIGLLEDCQRLQH